MQDYRVTRKVLAVWAVVFAGTLCAEAQDKASSVSVPVRMTVTLAPFPVTNCPRPTEQWLWFPPV